MRIAFVRAAQRQGQTIKAGTVIDSKTAAGWTDADCRAYVRAGDAQVAEDKPAAASTDPQPPVGEGALTDPPPSNPNAADVQRRKR